MTPRDTDRPIDTSPTVADEVKTTTCYMCACRCGIKSISRMVKSVTSRAISITRSTKACCAPRVGRDHAALRPGAPAGADEAGRPAGSGEFVEIDWEEALEMATGWLSAIRASDPRKLAFFTGRTNRNR